MSKSAPEFGPSAPEAPSVRQTAYFGLPVLTNTLNTETRRVNVPQYVASRGYLKVPAWTTATYDTLVLPTVDDDDLIQAVARPVTIKAIELDVEDVVAQHNFVAGKPSLAYTADDAMDFWQTTLLRGTFNYDLPLGTFEFAMQTRGRTGRIFVVEEETCYNITTQDKDARGRFTAGVKVSASGRHLTVTAGSVAVKALKAPTIKITPAVGPAVDIEQVA